MRQKTIKFWTVNYSWTSNSFTVTGISERISFPLLFRFFGATFFSIFGVLTGVKDVREELKLFSLLGNNALCTCGITPKNICQSYKLSKTHLRQRWFRQARWWVPRLHEPPTECDAVWGAWNATPCTHFQPVRGSQR